VAIVMGDFYTGSIYPVEYRGAAFFTDFGDPTIRAVQLDANGVLQQSLVVMGSVGTVVEMSMGPDGFMYYVDLYAGRVGRIEYGAAGASFASSDEGDVFYPTLEAEPFVGPRPELWLGAASGVATRGRMPLAASATSSALAIALPVFEQSTASASVGVFAASSSVRSAVRPAPRSSLTPLAPEASDEAFALLLVGDTAPVARDASQDDAPLMPADDTPDEESTDAVLADWPSI
jgi:hypothetical protein